MLNLFVFLDPCMEFVQMSVICSLNLETTHPVIKRINMNEFLIRQRDFGLIVNEKGMAKVNGLLSNTTQLVLY
jgi:hypothetical protein